MTIDPINVTTWLSKAGDVGGEQAAHLGDIARQARNDLAHPANGIKIKRERLQVGIQVFAQIENDMLANVGEQVGLEKSKDRLQ